MNHLELHPTSISDAGLVHLERCHELRTLNLSTTNVTAAGVAKLQQALPRCLITWDAPAPPVDAAAVADLQKALPDCKIEWDGETTSEVPPPAIAPFDEAQAKSPPAAQLKDSGDTKPQ